MKHYNTNTLPRFEFYSLRIRSIRYDLFNLGVLSQQLIRLDDSVWDFLCHSPHYWRNLRRLQINHRQTGFPWFLCSTQISQLKLKTYFPEIESADSTTSPFDNFLKLLLKYLPNLTHIDFRECDGYFTEENSLRLLDAYPYIQYIGLPYGCITPPVAIALATLPYLQVVTQGPVNPFLYSDIHESNRTAERRFNPNLPEHSFTYLRSFTLNGTVGDARRFITRSIPGANLTELCICSCNYETTGSFIEFLKTLTITCPMLSSLQLELLGPVSEEKEIRLSQLYHDLFSLRNLRQLGLTHPVLFRADDAQLEIFAKNLPRLTNFKLTCPPYNIDDPQILPYPGPDSLLSFAKHCPDLRTLCLRFGNIQHEIDWEGGQYHTPTGFQSLEQLDFDGSPLSFQNAQPLSRLLIKILPSYCLVKPPYLFRELVQALRLSGISRRGGNISEVQVEGE